MLSKLAVIRKQIRKFDEDESGDALQTVMILAIAAFVVAMIIIFGKDIVNWAKNAIQSMIGGGDNQFKN